jgi:fructokinase
MDGPSPAGRFVVVGESLVDIVHPVDGRPTEAPGGSPMNVAVGLARLGVPTTLVTELGEDPYGELVADHVRASGVDLADGSVRPDHPTSTATAHLGADGAATYEFELTWSLEPTRLPKGTTGMHVGSLGAVLEPGRPAVLDLLEQARAAGLFVSYDPNVRPAFPASWEGVAEVARYADVVKLSDEDLELLRPGASTAEVAGDLLETERTHLVVVTRGPLGSMAFTKDTHVEVEAPRTDLVDTVGAGDSFMAALVAVLLEWGNPDELDTQKLRTLVEAAGLAAAITCSRRGANPPTRRELPPGWPEPE